jgi:hypothetical protein
VRATDSKTVPTASIMPQSEVAWRSPLRPGSVVVAAMSYPRIFLSVVALAAGLSRACAADPPPPASDIVELPKFEVTDSRILPPPEKWHYAAIPGFEILASISERETKRFVRDFLLLQDAIGILLPAMSHTDVTVPTSLILCGRGDGAERFVPADRGDDTYRTSAFFFDDPERAAIVVDFALSELQLDAATTVDADPYREFYKEYFRHMIRHQVGRPPPWFEEGLVQMFSAIDFDRKTITFAEIGDGFGGGKDSDFNRLLHEHFLMPFPEMFAHDVVTTDAYWSAQCYAFVHMCLYGRGKIYQQGFLKFLTRASREQPTEEMFKECFKKTFKQMETELRGYVEFTDHKYVEMRAKKGQELPEPPPAVLRAATEAEAGRIVGNALRLGGHGGDAHLALIAPYIRGSRDPQLLAALGLDERLEEHNDRAKKFLEAAVQAKVVRPRAYLELARLRYEAAQAAKDDEGKFTLTPAQVADVLAPLTAASAQPPPLAEVYELAAEVWSHSSRPPGRADLKLINQGVMAFPRRAVLLARAADLNLRHGDPEDARKIITYALDVLPNSPARIAIEQLRDELPPEPPKPAAPSSAPLPAKKS